MNEERPIIANLEGEKGNQASDRKKTTEAQGETKNANKAETGKDSQEKDNDSARWL